MKQKNAFKTVNLNTQIVSSTTLTVRSNECHLLMTNPRSKTDQLSETTKSWLKEKAVEQVLGLKKTVETKQMKKGTMCLPHSIDLYNQVMQTNYKQNNRTKHKYGFVATPTLLGGGCAIKVCTSWDATTFPFFDDEVSKLVKRAGYDWQCRVYMMLFEIDTAQVSYCLVDTPMEAPDGEILLHYWDDYLLHKFEGSVDPQKRVSVSAPMERDQGIEKKMLERYEVANSYYQKYVEELCNK